MVGVAAAAQRQLEPGAFRAYAIATARNILVTHNRSENVTTPRPPVVGYTTLAGAEELTLEREETNALAATEHHQPNRAELFTRWRRAMLA